MDNINKISIKEVLKEGYYLYKNNFKLLFGVSAIGFLINLIYITGDYLTTYFKNPAIPSFVPGLIFFVVLAIPNIYFSSVITITLIKLIYNISNNHKGTFKETYKFAKSRFWTYFGTSILIGIILLIPFIVEMCIATFYNQGIIKYIAMTIFFIPMIYLIIRYYFATTLAVINLRYDTSEYLGVSKKLVKGCFFKILIIAVITQFVFWIPSAYTMIVPTSLKMSPTCEYMFDIVKGIIAAIYDPFAQAVTIVILKQLISSKLTIKPVVDETSVTN